MRFKVLAVVAAVALIAGCETAPEQSAAASGAGGSAQPTASAPARMGPVAGSKEDFVVNVGDRVFFDFDKFDLKPEAQATLKKQAGWLQKYPSVAVTVEGHADERGTREYNLALGERRANSVKDYLSALGIARTRVNIISYGKERPVALGHDEAAWSQNRRAVTTLTSGAAGS
ncbi:peptidoglycan-associated lipoprotein Pal [Shumkonia mesophila]|uniref:peptidoglycan-associated lipoprotein Pal n=1 Tax=Shumkonia mesophila TaxID=2838854 RepID=UPI0029350104|nr:peptidoglycan-associated lipoprotein Pal [Shumkonia mesophila]